jgi:hypothetical protein
MSLSPVEIPEPVPGSRVAAIDRAVKVYGAERVLVLFGQVGRGASIWVVCGMIVTAMARGAKGGGRKRGGRPRGRS